MNIIYTVDLIGTFVFAISGALAAIDHETDIFGISVIAFVTAVGGGTLRDVLIGSTPVGWMEDTNYLLVILLGIAVGVIFREYIFRLSKTIFLFDAIGIGLFTVLGLEKTLALGLSPLVAVLMGVVSAVFGGVVRDILVNRLPLIFRKEIYATPCFAGGFSYLLLSYIWPEGLGVHLYLAGSIVVLIRVLAVKFHWAFPVIRKS